MLNGIMIAKKQNTADQHYLLIKAASSLLPSVLTFEPSLKLLWTIITRGQYVPQQREEGNYEL
jgi:hypothetical protein